MARSIERLYDAQQIERVFFVVDGEHVNPAEVAQSGQGLSALGLRMLAPRLDRVGMDDHQREAHAERRTSSFTSAGRLDRAAVHFDDVANDCQTQSQAA